jgi:hypothetical protein
MQAIVTRFMPPTNHRNPRIKVEAAAGKMIVNWVDQLSIEENHRSAAMKFVVKFDWPRNDWYQGTMPDGTGDVFVCIPRKGSYR